MNTPTHRTQTPTSNINTAAEQEYWRKQYDKEGYYEAGRGFDEYEGAYRTGYEGRNRYADRDFKSAENDLQRDWESVKGNTQLGWEKARSAVRAAWDRVERAMPGDADKDGR